MGTMHSKKSSHIPSSLSFRDRRARSNSIDQVSDQVSDNSSRRSKRISVLSGDSNMENRGSSSTLRDGGHLNVAAAATDTSSSARKSSRRRTRSIALLQQNEGDTAEDDNEDITSRRIRRRIKGKSRQTETESTDVSEGMTNQIKGKKRQTDDNEGVDQTEEGTRLQGEAAEQSGGREEFFPFRLIQRPSHRQSSVQTLPPRVDPLLPPVSTNTTSLQQESAVPADGSRPRASPNPYELTNEDRNRARAQIARALGVGEAAQTAASRLDASDQSHPSVLSALLTDILGLRSGQAVPSEATPGSRSNDPSTGGRDNSRPRPINGGTSVIVQGALISRTAPSRPTVPTNGAASSAGEGESGSSARQRSQSQPAEPIVEAALPPAPEPSLPVESETQVATIEEQAAMLVRLLSIATAATAASLVSRSPQQQRQRHGSGNGNASTDTSVSNANLDSTSSLPAALSTPITPTATAQTNTTSTAESPSSTLFASPSSTSSSSWRQAAQTYHTLRERFHSLRSRFRGLRAAAQTERAQASAVEEVADSQQESANAEAGQSSEEEAAGSLRSLSSMLQDAIRDGVTSSERSGAATQGTETNQSSSPADQTATTRAQSVHATLDAVRGGHLRQGSPSSFDRFLFDLMGDLDVAIRGLSRGHQTEQIRPPAMPEPSMQERMIRHRRLLDVHDGQLAFYRRYTFRNLTNNANGEAPPDSALLPCVVVGVRNLEPNNRTLRIVQVNTEAETGVFLTENDGDTVMQDEAASAPASASAPMETAPSTSATAPTATATATATAQQERPMSRFLLFVSGGHYPPSHPVFFASRRDASRDLMILMEFLGAMASMHSKPNSTVTKEQIEKSKLRKVTGNHDEISSLVKENKIMENTSERCLICLEDWKNESEDRRLLECAHLFHAPCIDQWLTGSNNSCPLCRRQAVATSSTDPPPSVVPTATSLAQ